MKDDHYEFSLIGAMAALAIFCLVGIGCLVIFENVTKDNSFGIDGIIEALKSIASGLVGGLITMTRGTSALPTPTTAPIPLVVAAPTNAVLPQEKQS